MSFLSEIKKFDGKSLKPVDTNLTTADGKKVKIVYLHIKYLKCRQFRQTPSLVQDVILNYSSICSTYLNPRAVLINI